MQDPLTSVRNWLRDASQDADPEWAGFGSIAVERGYLTPRQWQTTIEEQAFLAQKGESARIGQILVKAGLLTGTQLCEILSLQRGSEVHPSMRGRIGKYRVKREIARGGMGIVLEAEDPDLKRTVALKVLIEGEHGDDAVKRFHREATIAAGLKHPNIIAIHEVGTAVDEWGKELHYIAMDYVAGTTLSDQISQGKASRNDLLSTLAVVARAVSFAHARGVIHRDLKPSNVLLENSGRVVLSDFGLAHANDSGTRITKSDELVGTPEYMAPEQVLRQRNAVDERTDVYALGVMMYKILTGRLPFKANTPVELLAQIASAEPTSPSSINRRIPRDLETICLKAMEKRKGRRYPSATAFADDVGRFLRGEPILARPPGAAYRLRRTLFRHRWAFGTVGATLVVGFALGAHLWKAERARRNQSGRLDEETRKRADADREAARLGAEVTYRDLGQELYSLKALQYRSDCKLTEARLRKFRQVEQRCCDQMERTGESPEGWWIVGRVREIGGDVLGAAAAFERGLQIDRAHGRCLLSKARILMRRYLRAIKRPEDRENAGEAVQEALELLDRGIQDGRVEEVEKDLAQGYQLLLKGEGAPEFCERMIAKWKERGQDGWEEFYLIRGQSRPERLFEDAQEALKVLPGSPAAWFLSGRGAEVKGDLARAGADFSHALELNPRDAYAYFHRARCRARSGDLEGAIEDLGKAIETDPKFSEAYNNRGRFRLLQKDYTNAIRDFERAIENDDKNVEAYVNLGSTYSQMGNLDLAIQNYARAGEGNPHFAPAWYSLGKAYCQRGDFDRAVENLSQAVAVQPDFAQAYCLRGAAQSGRRDYAAAIGDFDQALTLNPTLVEAYWNRAEAFRARNDYRKAIPDYDAYIRRVADPHPKASVEDTYSIEFVDTPSVEHAFYYRGLAHFALGELIPAIRDFGKTIDWNASYLGAYWNRSHAWKLLGRTGEAMGDLERLLKIAPQDWTHRPQAQWELELLRSTSSGHP